MPPNCTRRPTATLTTAGVFHRERQGPHDTPVYEVTLQPEDGLYPLPYMARQASGQAWEGDGSTPMAPAAQCRQPFYPDASRLFEEIDRLGVDDERAGQPAVRPKRRMTYYRARALGRLYQRACRRSQRTDIGEGDIASESLGQALLPVSPGTTCAGNRPMSSLARLDQRGTAGAG